MVAARSARSFIGFGDWERFVGSIDWTRLHIESTGYHLSHGGEYGQTCGECLRRVMLMEDHFDW